MNIWPTLDLLNPDQLPQRQETSESVLDTRIFFIFNDCLRVLTDVRRQDTFSERRERMNALYEKNMRIEPVAVSVGTSKERYGEHDGYFGIRRIDGEIPSVLFMQSLFMVQSELAEERMKVGFNAEPSDYLSIQLAIQALFDYLTPDQLKQTVEAICQAMVGSHPDTEASEAGYRWRIGHHIFAVLIQGLIILFNGFGSAYEEKDEQKAKEALDLAATLMVGSEAAIRLTSAFPSADYTQRVRPAMSPPHLETGFSGLQSIDHHYLVQRLKSLHALFTHLSPQLLPSYQRFLQAFDSTYVAHIQICAYFVGKTAPSLRMGNQEQRPAIEKLDKLRHTRRERLKP